MRRIGWALAVSGAIAGAAEAQHSHVALVVGNSEYAHVSDLPNAINDAKAVSRKLTEAGYRTTVVLNVTQSELLRALAELRVNASEASQAVIYFSGHGAQSDGETLLLMRDVTAEPDALAMNSVPLRTLIKAVSDKPRQKIVLLDACRTSPLEPGKRTSGADQPLAAGTYVAFASQPGGEAFDGSGELSPFARALVTDALGTAHPIAEAMRKVRVRVVTETGGQQVPWSMNALLRDANFAGVNGFTTGGQEVRAME